MGLGEAEQVCDGIMKGFNEQKEKTFVESMRNTLPGVRTLLKGTLDKLGITWGK
jgi:hypothetical protein